MSLKLIATTPVLAACAAATAIALGAPASAEPQQCTNDPSASSTVCQRPGDSGIVVTPPAQGSQPGGTTNGQNGEYGPHGDTPPLGHD